MTALRIPTTGEVYRAILNSHREGLVVYESFSDPDGSFGGQKDSGSMYTIWGLKHGCARVIEARTTFDLVESEGIDPFFNTRYNRVNEQHKFWLYLSQPTEE